MLENDEILKFISEDKTSGRKREAKIGQKYYDGEHDILDYRMFYFNSDGKLVEDDTRSNVKIPHPFFTELVDQTVQYMLSGKDELIKSDIPELQTRLDEYFDDDFICELNDVLTGTQSKGFEYMYAYMNRNGKMSFECADGLGVVEVTAKDSSDGEEYIIYYYDDRIMKDDKIVTRVQVWDDERTYFLFWMMENLLKMTKNLSIQDHMSSITKKVMIPFIMTHLVLFHSLDWITTKNSGQDCIQ